MDEDKIKELEDAAATLRQEIEDLNSKVQTLETERDTLNEYKETREREDSEAELLKKRLGVLTEAGFEFDKEQVESKQPFWLSLDEDAFTAYVEHMAEIKESSASAEDGDNSGVPDLSSDASKEKNLDILRTYLDKRYKKNKE